MSEFSGIRSTLYKESHKEFPSVRNQDIEVMKKYLMPTSGETILEVGAGSGFFSGLIADTLEQSTLYVSDPSAEQLDAVKALHKNNIKTVQEGAEELTLPADSVDAIWSFGAMHHVFSKVKSFNNFHSILKKGAKLIIADVFSGSSLAQHFDDKVAKFSATGHEVSFLSHEYAKSLCLLTGFESPILEDLHIEWVFENKEDIGIFLYKLHAMTKTTPEECTKGAEEILGITQKDGKYFLSWPMTVLVTYKK
jgi:arsenite methyltransferase